jgi:amino acid transporter
MSFVLRTLGYVLGLLGGLLITIGSLLALVPAVSDLLSSRVTAVPGSLILTFVVFVIGVLALVVARRGRHFWTPRRTLTSGLLMIALAVIALLLTGLGGGLLVLVGAALVLFAGILYLAGMGSRLFRLFASV